MSEAKKNVIEELWKRLESLKARIERLETVIQRHSALKACFDEELEKEKPKEDAEM